MTNAKMRGKNPRWNDRNLRRPISMRCAKYGWAMGIFEKYRKSH